MKTKKSIIGFNQLPLLLLLLFVLANWIILVDVMELAPPDFYNYHFQYKKLVTGNFSWHVPPGYPLLIGLFGGFLSLFVSGTDTYILAGRLISLFFGLGLVYYSFRILKKFLKEYYFPATALLITQTFFLIYMAAPLTDIIFLCFTVMSFYYLSEEKFSKSIMVAFLSMLVRFEGLLLVFSTIAGSLKREILKKRLSFYSVFSGIMIMILYISTSKRLINKILFIIDRESFLFFLINPDKLIKLFYLNIFFFLPRRIPYSYQLLLFSVSFLIFVYGAYIVYKKGRRFFFSIMIYFISFIIIKGYVAGVGGVFIPGNEGRRLLSAVFLYWLFFTIGLFTAILKSKVSVSIPGRILVYSLFILFFLFTYFNGLSQAKREMDVFPKKGSVMIARWINSNLKDGDKIVTYSSGHTIDYYLKKKVKRYVYLIKSQNRRFERFMEKFLKSGCKYIVTDFHVNLVDKPYHAKIKNMLRRKSRKGNGIFIKKKLRYKKKVVAFVLKLDKKFLKSYYGQKNILLINSRN
ncbi:MAG: hypothetical protein ABFR75_13610 [Acidobacteriota bacterium]